MVAGFIFIALLMTTAITIFIVGARMFSTKGGQSRRSPKPKEPCTVAGRYFTQQVTKAGPIKTCHAARLLLKLKGPNSRHFIIAALLAFGLARDAHAQSDYDFTLNLSGVAAGTQYSQSVIQSTWTEPHLTYQWTGDTGTHHFFWVVHNGLSSDTCLNSRCLEMRYAAGGVGAASGVAGWGTSSFQIRFQRANVINVEWDMLFESSYDTHGIQKVPMHIWTWDATNSWWTLGQENVQCSGEYNATKCNGSPIWVAYEERSNGTNACASYFGPTNKAVRKHFWYHLRRQVDYTNAPASTVTKLWIKGPGDSNPLLVWTCTWNSYYNPAVRPWGIIENEFHWGGAGNNDRAQTDSQFLVDNIHVYTGATPPG